MIKGNSPALQVLLNGKWEYVFVRNEETNEIITSPTRNMAQRGNEAAIKYYQQHRNDLEYRIER